MRTSSTRRGLDQLSCSRCIHSAISVAISFATRLSRSPSSCAAAFLQVAQHRVDPAVHPAVHDLRAHPHLRPAAGPAAGPGWSTTMLMDLGVISEPIYCDPVHAPWASSSARCLSFLPFIDLLRASWPWRRCSAIHLRDLRRPRRRPLLAHLLRRQSCRWRHPASSPAACSSSSTASAWRWCRMILGGPGAVNAGLIVNPGDHRAGLPAGHGDQRHHDDDADAACSISATGCST